MSYPANNEFTSKRFTNKTILITGGNSGIGFATAQRIVAEGGRVIITGRDRKTLEAAKQELGKQAEFIQADVGRLSEIDVMFEHIKDKNYKLDGLFANAGIAKFMPIDQVTETDFDSLFDINVKGLFFTLQKAIPYLSQGSSVVLNASVAGSRGGVESCVYGATKAAVRSLARTFSSSYVAKGIRFNAVSPGPIETPIWGRLGGLTPDAVDATKQKMADSTPIKRNGTADEVAATVAFLLSSESSYILGAEIFVDGGKNQI
jgi:NAD(P)-dependent dehydrogenase (short-subunit alcohol dehydrogenase family)